MADPLIGFGNTWQAGLPAPSFWPPTAPNYDTYTVAQLDAIAAASTSRAVAMGSVPCSNCLTRSGNGSAVSFDPSSGYWVMPSGVRACDGLTVASYLAYCRSIVAAKLPVGSYSKLSVARLDKINDYLGSSFATQNGGSISNTASVIFRGSLLSLTTTASSGGRTYGIVNSAKINWQHKSLTSFRYAAVEFCIPASFAADNCWFFIGIGATSFTLPGDCAGLLYDPANVSGAALISTNLVGLTRVSSVSAVAGSVAPTIGVKQLFEMWDDGANCYFAVDGVTIGSVSSYSNAALFGGICFNRSAVAGSGARSIEAGNFESINLLA